MAKIAKVDLKPLEYNQTLVLMLIAKDEQLKTLFLPELPLSIELMITCAKEDRIQNPKIIDLLQSVFKDVIMTHADLHSLYQTVAYTNGITLAEVLADTKEEEEEEVEPAKVVEPKVSVKKKKLKAKSDLPRRYGKEKIEADIAKQGGKATPVQLAMLRVNNLKNLWVNLQARGIKTMLSDDKVLTDVDCRDITSAIQIMERKLELVLKRK
jgi:hypothetical protein